MSEHEREKLVGTPSDYGGRTIEDEEAEARREPSDRTADGDPLSERGTADSAISRDLRSDELQGDNDFDQTNAKSENLIDQP